MNGGHGGPFSKKNPRYGHRLGFCGHRPDGSNHIHHRGCLSLRHRPWDDKRLLRQIFQNGAWAWPTSLSFPILWAGFSPRPWAIWRNKTQVSATYNVGGVTTLELTTNLADGSIRPELPKKFVDCWETAKNLVK